MNKKKGREEKGRRKGRQTAVAIISIFGCSGETGNCREKRGSRKRREGSK